MPVQNAQREMERIIAELGGRRARLLLHGCCAPCSSYVLETLSRAFDIVLYYYNPNISPQEEYSRRLDEVRRLVGQMPLEGSVTVESGAYEPARFAELARGREDEPEGGSRCRACYELRLREAAAAAARLGCEFFTTTLSISPHKNAAWLNELGEQIERETGVRYLPADFKKRGGTKRSIELSRQYDLYRQDYCGCIYSKREAARRRERTGRGQETDAVIQ
ncbi:epoxyqueuosine reductase QueH [Feifania hominis]|uniref:Epoxyqueuosine reductase QueH n=1 Tax=Feifania hominis TaxID=2763660 RepID=A0A926HU27_9FIRM|nr:epoxyqueuosine reductase QueH [Feifania hominis]MBC8535878.1 epoxyqueuosine reductase QueH [Feifania hominis]